MRSTGAVEEEDDFSSFGLPAGSPSTDASASLTAAETAAADDDDEFSEFGVPAYPEVASSIPAIDDDDEFAEVRQSLTHTILTPVINRHHPLPAPLSPPLPTPPPRPRLRSLNRPNTLEPPTLSSLTRLCSLPCRLPRNLR